MTECIVRDAMPQVDEVDLPELIKFLRDGGVQVLFDRIDPNKIRGRQKVDRHKVHAMGTELLDKPILVSEEPLIVDGNHRWMKGLVTHRKWMNAYKIILPFDDCLKAVFEFPKTYHYGDGAFHPIRN